MNEPLYIAVDLGAGSGRVFLVGVAPGELLLEEAYRFHYPPARRQGHLRWDLHGVFADIKAGLFLAGEKAQRLKRPVVSVAVSASNQPGLGFVEVAIRRPTIPKSQLCSFGIGLQRIAIAESS